MPLVGVDALRRRYGSIRQAIESGQLFEEAGHQWVEEDFKPYAKQICPVGETGNLRNSIDGEVNPNQVRVFADKDYASYVEEGTSKMAAQPFMRPAFDRTRPKFSDRTRAALKRILT